MARRAIDVALPLLTGDATMNASDLVKTDPLAKELMKAPPEQVLSMAMHERPAPSTPWLRQRFAAIPS
jgi:hypothetical protein